MGKIQKMVDYAVAIAKDDKHGYSQSRRWPSQGTDFDCSSLMYDAAHHAGYDVTVGPSGTHYTGTMLDDFQRAGFKLHRFDGNLADLKKGDILVRDPWGAGGHTEMYIGNGKFVGAHASEHGTADGAPGDQTGREISICDAYGGWDYVLTPPSEGASVTKPTAKKRLNGIDIASYQQSLAPSKMSTTDFIIVKATGGNSYKNPCFKDHADATLGAGKLLGCYHFACEYGIALKPEQEADYFLNAVQPYVGKATLWLDYEMDALDNYSPAWCKKWLDRVKAKTGSTPGIYMSKSACNTRDWSAVAKEYPLWVAQYPDYSETGYQDAPWTDSTGYGAWKAPTIFQYTSSGKIPGYNAHLDLDLFYGSKEDWMALAKKQTPKPDPKWPDGTYVVAIQKVGIRSRRSTASTLCCTAAKGARLKLRDLRANKAGNVWGQVASGDHSGRYVMVYSAAKKVNRMKLEHG